MFEYGGEAESVARVAADRGAAAMATASAAPAAAVPSIHARFTGELYRSAMSLPYSPAMSTHDATSRTLTEALGLALPPIAIAVCDDVPAGVPVFAGSAPAGCRFWEDAARGAFATRAADHELCAIGIHTHNITGASDQAKQELGAVLKVMADLDYVREADVAQIPVLERAANVVVYAPLADCPVEPDVVVLFAKADQSLVLSEAVQHVDGAVAPAMGRPACAMVPQAINAGRAAMSLGCCGARAYLDALTDDVALWALPGAKIAAYAERIAAFANANAILTKFHTRRRQDVEAGDRPTLEESLARS